MKKKLIIKESDWAYGNDKGFLQGEDGKCCLGFAAKACGVKVADMDGLGLPGCLKGEDRARVKRGFPFLLVGDGERDDRLDSVDATTLARINDARGMKLQTRRNKIKAIFAKHGVEVVFEK